MTLEVPHSAGQDHGVHSLHPPSVGTKAENGRLECEPSSYSMYEVVMELNKLGAKSSNNGNQESITWGDQGLVPDGCAPEPGLLEDLCVVGGHRSDWHAFKLYVGVAQVVGLVVVVGVVVSVEVWRLQLEILSLEER